MLRVTLLLAATLLSLTLVNSAQASDKGGHAHVYEADVKDDQGHDKTDKFDLSKPEDANRLSTMLAQGKVTRLKQEHIPPMEQMFSLRWDLGLWTIVVFGGLLFILSKTAWPAMLDGLKKREQNISDAIAAAETAKLEAERTQNELRAEMAKANDNIRAMMDEARKDASAAKDEMLTAAKKEIGEERDRMRREIETARDQALLDIWNQSTQLASLISSKTIKREIRPDDHKKLFEEAMKEMKAAAAKGTA